MIKDSLKLSASLARATPFLRPVSLRYFASNANILDEKEKGDERVYFKRQEGIIIDSIFFSIDERLKRLQDSLKKQGFEQVPSEI